MEKQSTAGAHSFIFMTKLLKFKEIKQRGSSQSGVTAQPRFLELKSWQISMVLTRVEHLIVEEGEGETEAFVNIFAQSSYNIFVIFLFCIFFISGKRTTFIPVRTLRRGAPIFVVCYCSTQFVPILTFVDNVHIQKYNILPLSF